MYQFFSKNLCFPYNYYIVFWEVSREIMTLQPVNKALGHNVNKSLKH